MLMMMSSLTYSSNGLGQTDSLTILNLPRSEWVAHIRQANALFFYQNRQIDLLSQIVLAQDEQIEDYIECLILCESKVEDYKRITTLSMLAMEEQESIIIIQRRVIRTLIGVILIGTTYTIIK